MLDKYKNIIFFLFFLYFSHNNYVTMPPLLWFIILKRRATIRATALINHNQLVSRFLSISLSLSLSLFFSILIYWKFSICVWFLRSRRKIFRVLWCKQCWRWAILTSKEFDISMNYSTLLNFSCFVCDVDGFFLNFIQWESKTVNKVLKWVGGLWKEFSDAVWTKIDWGLLRMLILIFHDAVVMSSGHFLITIIATDFQSPISYKDWVGFCRISSWKIFHVQHGDRKKVLQTFYYITYMVSKII